MVDFRVNGFFRPWNIQVRDSETQSNKNHDCQLQRSTNEESKFTADNHSENSCFVTVSPGLPPSSAAVLSCSSSSSLPVGWSSPPCAVDYLHQTRLFHTMAYPTLNVGSVIWPMEIVPAATSSMVQPLGQAFYSGYPAANNPFGSIEYAAGMIQKREDASKMIKKLRPKRFRCEHCDVAFSNNGQLKGHVRIHTGERPFKCEEKGCEKSFTRNEELTRHKRIHTGVRPHACSICGKCFGRKDHLKKHTRTHENRDLYATSAAAMGLYNLGHAAPPFHPYVFHF